MEGKLKEVMDSCDLNMFETLNLAIRVASCLHPTELALRRDHIIESLYRTPIVRGEDGAGVSNKKAEVARKACAQSGQLPTARQELPHCQRGTTDAKRKSKMPLPEEPGACARDEALKIKEVPSLPVQCNTRLVPVGTNQGHSSTAKDKGKLPPTYLMARCAMGLNKRNNQASSSDIKGKNTVPHGEKMKEHDGTSSKSLSIRDGKLRKKLKSGHSESFQRPNGDKESSVPAMSDDLIEIQDDSSSDGENEEDPLDWWTEEELERSDNPANASNDG